MTKKKEYAAETTSYGVVVCVKSNSNKVSFELNEDDLTAMVIVEDSTGEKHTIEIDFRGVKTAREITSSI